MLLVRTFVVRAEAFFLRTGCIWLYMVGYRDWEEVWGILGSLPEDGWFNFSKQIFTEGLSTCKTKTKNIKSHIT